MVSVGDAICFSLLGKCDSLSNHTEEDEVLIGVVISFIRRTKSLVWKSTFMGLGWMGSFFCHSRTVGR